MIKIVLYVIVLSVLITVAVWFADEPGSVSVSWLGWQLNTSVAILFVILALLLFSGTVLIRLWGALLGAGRAFRDARKDRRTATGLDALAAGFAAVLGEDGPAAKRALGAAESALGETPVVRLLKQQTARVGQDGVTASAEARDMLDDPILKLAALRDLADAARQTGDFDSALKHAKRAAEQKPSPPWALHMCLDLNIATQRWADAATLLNRKDVQGLLKEMDIKRLHAALASRAAVDAVNRQTFDDAITWARKALALDATRADAVAALARALNATGKAKKAAAEVQKAWTINPHPALLAAYLELAPGEAPLARTSRVETLVRGNPDHPESRLAVAETSLAAELWGQARSRVEPLIDGDAQAPTRERAAALMAQIELGERDDSKAAAIALSKALSARTAPVELPEPASAAEMLSRPY
jgi:HemY protein